MVNPRGRDRWDHRVTRAVRTLCHPVSGSTKYFSTPGLQRWAQATQSKQNNSTTLYTLRRVANTITTWMIPRYCLTAATTKNYDISNMTKIQLEEGWQMTCTNHSDSEIWKTWADLHEKIWDIIPTYLMKYWIWVSWMKGSTFENIQPENHHHQDGSLTDTRFVSYDLRRTTTVMYIKFYLYSTVYKEDKDNLGQQTENTVHQIIRH